MTRPHQLRTLRAVRLRQGRFLVDKVGATRFDLRDPYYIAIASSWPVFVLLGGCLLIGAVSLFALLFLIDPRSVAGVAPGDFVHAFFFSLQVISTAGFGITSPNSLYGYFIAGAERVIGIAMLPVVTGLLFVRFSRSRPGIVFADHPVVTTKDGAPQLRVRIANCKATVLTAANAKLTILLRERDGAGELWRRYHDLELVRDSLPIFALTWTLMHVIDASSPLYGKSEADLEAAWGQLVLSVEARDPRLGHSVDVVTVYDAKDILFGHHYSPAVEHRADGFSSADITRLSLATPDNPPLAKPHDNPV